MENKTLSILGSTGSIGVQALDVARLHNFRIRALTSNTRIDLLESQIREFSPEIAAVADEKAAADLKLRVKDTSTRVLAGEEGVCEAAAIGADTVLNGIVGIAGLRPTLAAIGAGGTLALANKETLVAAGEYVMNYARERGVPILPVDSEHSAIFQSLAGCRSKSQISRLILTASGGPFFGKTKQELENVTLEDALKHPNWSMGAKITIDSATMMNKGLELIEAAWLFGMEPDRIDIVVHRQSVVHSLVEYVDNSVIAQLGVPDMRIPIQYAITYPDRFVSPVRQLNLAEWANLTFDEPDYETFPCINLCRRAINEGGLLPAAANAANEQANAMFRRGEIRFSDIPRAVAGVFDLVTPVKGYTPDDVFETDRYIRKITGEKFGK